MKRMMKLFRRGMSCEDILEVLQAYLDGEVDAETARKVADHLADCTECDHESKVFHNIKATLAKRAQPIDPKVMAALQKFGSDLVAESAE